MSKTYLVTNAGDIKGELLYSSSIKQYDYVLGYNNSFEYAQYSDAVPHQAKQFDGKYYVIRNYNLKDMASEITCSACKGAGGTISYRGVEVMSGYKSHISYDVLGYSNGAIISTPQYKTIGSYKTKTPCKVCNGSPVTKTNDTKIEIRQDY